MQWLSNHTEDLQSQFAEYCRTGKPVSLPGTNPQRMKHYRKLSFSVIYNALEQAYPITQQVLTDSEWTDLADGFYANHENTTPLLWQMPHGFYEYVANSGLQIKEDYPFLPELLYFEWLEIEVHTMEDIPYPEGFVKSSDFTTENAVAVNPEHRLVQLSYPLHLKAVEEAIKEPGNYYVLIYRHPESGNVKFMNLSVLFAFAFSLFAEKKLNIYEAAKEIENQFGLGEEKQVIKHLNSFLNEMSELEAVSGIIKK
ncbi:MAG TPA: putative DNA-binding domain-containing protein [Bacteroidales bacterium]|nr:putative DNA-binding domain-containing protein [Bacteroidales bacterium]